MSKASGIYVKINIKLGAEISTDAPALGAAIADLRREGWSLEEYESGEEGREGYAILSRGWDISVRRSQEEGAYEVVEDMGAGEGKG